MKKIILTAFSLIALNCAFVYGQNNTSDTTVNQRRNEQNRTIEDGQKIDDRNKNQTNPSVNPADSTRNKKYTSPSDPKKSNTTPRSTPEKGMMRDSLDRKEKSNSKMAPDSLK